MAYQGKVVLPHSKLSEVKDILVSMDFVSEEKSEFLVAHARHFTNAVVDVHVNKAHSQLTVCMSNGAEVLVKEEVIALHDLAAYTPAKVVV